MEEHMNFDMDSIQVLAISYGTKIVAAIIVFLVGRFIAKWLTRVVVKILEKQNVDATLVKFLENVVYYILLIAVLVAAAGQLGVNVTSFLTILGAASLAVGLALKDSLSNFAAGVMLILFRPFRVGDVIDLGGTSGTVEEITVFNTIINTPDNKRQIIPNSIVVSGSITNVNANETRRVDLVAGIGYEDDIRKAKELLEKIVAEEKLVLKDPAPKIAVSELADSSVNFVVRPWVKTEDYWTVYFNLTEQIKLQFDQHGISIPYPQQDVHLHSVKDD